MTVLVFVAPRRLSRHRALLDPGDCLDLTSLGGLLEGREVEVILVGIRLGKFRDRVVERPRTAQIRGQCDPVAGASMCAGEGPGAKARVDRHVIQMHLIDGERELPVPQLTYVVVAV